MSLTRHALAYPSGPQLSDDVRMAHLSDETFRELVPTLLNRLPNNGVIIELGCGNGRFCTYLQEQRPDATVIGLEFNRYVAEYARQYVQQEESTFLYRDSFNKDQEPGLGDSTGPHFGTNPGAGFDRWRKDLAERKFIYSHDEHSEHQLLPRVSIQKGFAFHWDPAPGPASSHTRSTSQVKLASTGESSSKKETLAPGSDGSSGSHRPLTAAGSATEPKQEFKRPFFYAVDISNWMERKLLHEALPPARAIVCSGIYEVIPTEMLFSLVASLVEKPGARLLFTNLHEYWYNDFRSELLNAGTGETNHDCEIAPLRDKVYHQKDVMDTARREGWKVVGTPVIKKEVISSGGKKKPPVTTGEGQVWGCVFAWRR